MSHSKLHQIVRLREMLKKWRTRLALQKAHSFSDAGGRTAGGGSVQTRRSMSMPREGGSSRGAGRLPPGHLAVYVGEERRRFVIKMWYLSHPLFRALLKKTEEEIGFQQEGALALPCQVPFFEHLLHIIHSCKSHHHNIITSLLHRSNSPPHQDYPLADEQYQELLLQLLQSSDLPHYPLSPLSTHHDPLSSLTLSLSRSLNQAVVA